ncbi:hypothetical protein Hanom_Chr10g00896981 [Helianthus anomalus]
MDTKVGSLDSLYESLEILDYKHFSYNAHSAYDASKNALVNPWNSSLSLCQKLKIDLNNIKPVDARVSDSHDNLVFFKKRPSFIITDDLNIAPLMLSTSISLLKFLGVENINSLDERTMDFGFEEVQTMYFLITFVKKKFVLNFCIIYLKEITKTSMLTTKGLSLEPARNKGKPHVQDGYIRANGYLGRLSQKWANETMPHVQARYYNFMCRFG